ncbi:hypothetical protein BV25DRAFT_789080 [Artomyces pyxidatus]|uniref:Uncharacterized protein n=1 Tax=Artomyces pyxidatus TaxID=48021 RepID=A0ACB8SXA5_9AGAM|nr:hypothetical protein BV25DRAFT_789080 [Artomyces pyxidatus]
MRNSTNPPSPCAVTNIWPAAQALPFSAFPLTPLLVLARQSRFSLTRCGASLIQCSWVRLDGVRLLSWSSGFTLDFLSPTVYMTACSRLSSKA